MEFVLLPLTLVCHFSPVSADKIFWTILHWFRGAAIETIYLPSQNVFIYLIFRQHVGCFYLRHILGRFSGSGITADSLRIHIICIDFLRVETSFVEVQIFSIFPRHLCMSCIVYFKQNWTQHLYLALMFSYEQLFLEVVRMPRVAPWYKSALVWCW